MPTPERAIAEFVSTVTYGDLPASVVDTVTRAFVDTVGVTLAGSVADAGRRAAAATGVDPDEAALGERLGVDADAATEGAFRVGTAGHALDYDDMSRAMDGHPSVTLVPPLLTLAREADASGRDLITAYVAGFEAACALAAPITPGHYEAGWHATATLGTFGATAAAANLLDMDAETTERALNAAASMPAGLKRNFGSALKPAHAGLCSRSGVTAARMAESGFTADGTAISGDGGFWDLYGAGERGAFDVGDGLRLESNGIDRKSYPCCYFTHTAIAATRSLVEGGVDPSAVERVDVTASAAAADALRYPDPETATESKFSMEHAVACALVRDRVGLGAFEAAALEDPTVSALRERVDFAADPDRPYDSYGTTVEITTRTDTVVGRRDHPPGAHEEPLSEATLRTKFDECAGRVLPPGRVDDLHDLLSALPERDDVAGALIAV